MTDAEITDLADRMRYPLWLHEVWQLRGGWNGRLFILSILAVTLTSCWAVVQLLPPGTYIVQLVALPGIAIGWFFYKHTARAFFRLGLVFSR